MMIPLFRSLLANGHYLAALQIQKQMEEEAMEKEQDSIFEGYAEFYLQGLDEEYRENLLDVFSHGSLDDHFTQEDLIELEKWFKQSPEDGYHLVNNTTRWKIPSLRLNYGQDTFEFVNAMGEDGFPLWYAYTYMEDGGVFQNLLLGKFENNEDFYHRFLPDYWGDYIPEVEDEPYSASTYALFFRIGVDENDYYFETNSPHFRDARRHLGIE